MQIYTVLALLSLVVAVSAAPKDKDYEHKEPGYEHKEPGYEHKEPGYEHKEPGYEHKEPGYEHKEPGYEHKEPGYEHKEPGYEHNGPVYGPAYGPAYGEYGHHHRYHWELKAWFEKLGHELHAKLRCKWDRFHHRCHELWAAVDADLHHIGHKFEYFFKCNEKRFVEWWNYHQELCLIKRALWTEEMIRFYELWEAMKREAHDRYEERKGHCHLGKDYEGPACDAKGCVPQPKY